MRERMQADPLSGAVYVFRAKLADRMKLVLARHRRQSTRQAAGGRHFPPAERAGWRGPKKPLTLCCFNMASLEVAEGKVARLRAGT
jgi:hypothetical protein